MGTFAPRVITTTKDLLNTSYKSTKSLPSFLVRKIIRYNPKLVERANKLRNNMTIGEISLWREIKGKKLGYRFSRQIPIDQYIVDFYCKDLKLAIEVDGSIHLKEGQAEKDAIRQRRLESLGVTVIRFSDGDAKNNLSWVIDQIVKEIEKLGVEG